MPDYWNQPAGPPQGEPVSPSVAKREIEAAVVAACTEDRSLRARVVEVAAARVEARACLVAATEEVEEARALAKRALRRAEDSARAGQRADAARWTAAARVFAMRLRDGRKASAAADAAAVAAGRDGDDLEAAAGENVERLRDVAASRLPALRGRKAARSRARVDEALAALAVPLADEARRAEAEAQAALGAAGEAVGGVAPVADDELEAEVDETGTDEILDELRAEMGLAVGGSRSDGEGPNPAGGPGRIAHAATARG